MKSLRLLLSACLLSPVSCLLTAPAARAATPITDLQLSGANNQVKSGATLTVVSGGSLTIAAGGTLTFTSGTLVGTLAVANGGTGATTAANARTALGLAIGTNVQAYDADLTTFAGITPSANVQSLLGAADYAAMRTALGLVVGTNVQAYDADLTTFAGITPSANVQTLLGAADYAAIRAALDLEPGTDYLAVPGSSAEGDILFRNGSAWTRLPRGTTGQVIKATSSTIEWGTDSTGAGSLPGSPSTGDTAYYNGSAWVSLAIGTAGQVLAVNGGATAPAWAAANDFTSTLVNSEVSITAATSLTSSAFGKMHVCTGTSADYTVDLPAVSGNAGKIIGIRMSAALTKFVTLDGNSAETIDGATTRIMWANESAILLCDGTTWTKIAGKSIPLYASAERATAVNVTTDTATGIPVVDVIEQSVTGLIDTTNGVINIKRLGKYVIDSFMSYYGAFSAAGKEAYCKIGIDSMTADATGPSAIACVPTSINSAGTQTYAHIAFSATRSLAAGQYVAVVARQGTGSTMATREPTSVRPHLSVLEVPSW